MITAGLDIGSGLTKGVLVENGVRLLPPRSVPTRGNPAEAGRQVLELLVEEANLLPGEVDYLCTTGFGRYTFPDRDLQVSDITASARGAVFLFPATRHVLDVGSQSTRAISVSDTGRVLRFKMNERCAAGAGRFLERCAKYLQVPLESLGERAAAAEQPKLISSVCAVLAETEIINHIADGVPVSEILMGVFVSLAQRAHTLMRYVGISPEVTLVGGLVHNPGAVTAIERTIGLRVNVSGDAHYAAAIGAAVLAHRRLLKTSSSAAAAEA